MVTDQANYTDSAAGPVRSRPRLLQALGRDEPPHEIEVIGRSYQRLDLFKHDSWAATALYESETGERIVCKFHRRSLFLPFGWFGRIFARHESRILERLADVDKVPRLLGPVRSGGMLWKNSVARTFIAGHPLRKEEQVNDAFFPALQELLAQMHARSMAYVDLHKRENVIVGDNGLPYLIDFQISMALPRIWPLGAILRVLQRSDDYHLLKLWARCRPDQCGVDRETIQQRVPSWIRLHRKLAVPFRELRRKLLVRLRVRSGRGRVESELFAEDALRADTDRTWHPDPAQNSPAPTPSRPVSAVSKKVG